MTLSFGLAEHVVAPRAGGIGCSIEWAGKGGRMKIDLVVFDMARHDGQRR